MTFSPQFLADLDRIAPMDQAGNAVNFLQDLELAYICASNYTTVADPNVNDLIALENCFCTWRKKTSEQLRVLIDKLPNDDPLFSTVSLFGTMDMGRLETAHTRTLAWLLDKHDHGFEHRLLEELLRAVTKHPFQGIAPEFVKNEHPMSGGRLDIFARGQWMEESGEVSQWVLAIEAKIDATEGVDQLANYDRTLEKLENENTAVVRIFLTRLGNEAETATNEWNRLSFLNLAALFRNIEGLQLSPGYHFLRYYLTGVLKDVCGLQLPIKADCGNPYAALAYAEAVVNHSKWEA